jgi:membrane-bound serine protease (ClpP class)
MAARRRSSPPSRILNVALLSSALACWTAFLFAQEGEPPKVEQKAFKQAAVIRFDGMIDDWQQFLLNRKLQDARADGVDLVVLEVDSPGGELNASLELAETFNNLSDIHTVAFVPQAAYSGAAMISLGCDEIVMQPFARIGDVGVIIFDHRGINHAPEKFRSAVVAEMRALAAEHKRSPALAEAMVDMDVEVFRYVNQRTNAADYFSPAEVASRADAAEWEQREMVHESKKGTFLTLVGTRALELGIADSNVANLDELKARYQVSGKWRTYQTNSIDKTVYVLNFWWITGLLFVVGLVGILYECSAPGTCIGGLVGLTCFSLFFWSRFLGGTAGWLEVVLFALGIIFLALELFVLPGFGVAGFVGLALIAVSIVLACQTFVVPETMQQLKITTGAVATLLGSGAVFLVIAYAMTSYIGRIPFLSQLVLAPVPSPGSDDDFATADETTTGIPAAKKVAIGTIGQTTTILRPSGRALIDGQPMDVVSTGDVIGVGVKIRVVETSYQRIVVEEAE